MRLFAFPNFGKVGKLAASIKRPKSKSVSASEGFRPPDHLTRGYMPWTPLSPDNRYRGLTVGFQRGPPTPSAGNGCSHVTLMWAFFRASGV